MFEFDLIKNNQEYEKVSEITKKAQSAFNDFWFFKLVSSYWSDDLND